VLSSSLQGPLFLVSLISSQYPFLSLSLFSPPVVVLASRSAPNRRARPWLYDCQLPALDMCSVDLFDLASLALASLFPLLFFLFPFFLFGVRLFSPGAGTFIIGRFPFIFRGAWLLTRSALTFFLLRRNAQISFDLVMVQISPPEFTANFFFCLLFSPLTPLRDFQSGPDPKWNPEYFDILPCFLHVVNWRYFVALSRHDDPLCFGSSFFHVSFTVIWHRHILGASSRPCHVVHVFP